MSELKAMAKPREKSILTFQYYNLMVSCLEQEGNFDRIVEIREKVKKLLSTLKEKSNLAANGRQLLTIIDGVLTVHRQNITRAKEIYEELYENASFTLSRLTAFVEAGTAGSSYRGKPQCPQITVNTSLTRAEQRFL